jgi:hypothetical protein
MNYQSIFTFLAPNLWLGVLLFESSASVCDNCEAEFCPFVRHIVRVLYVSFASKNSRFNLAMCVTEIPLGHSASHA